MTYHVSTDSTPFELVYGRRPPALTQVLRGETKVEAVTRELVDCDKALRQLKYHLDRARGRMKDQADRKRRDVSFKIGEWIFLKLRPHVQNSVEARINPKLAPRYYGPFEITTRVGAVVYRLKLRAIACIHTVFHVSLLKKAIGNYRVETELPPGLDGDPAAPWESTAVLATRTITKEGSDVKQLLVHWNGKPVEESTLEDEFVMLTQFPALKLGDKSVTQGGGIDGDRRN
ncbi:uncharacterized protein [Cicer arietinum]|uniref:uncharacterized protein n=1 Tax=Cicer arietinum TaxID=3827 RepID=UPI00032A7E0A